MLQRKLLIVEDNDMLYDAMVMRLNQQMTKREMNVTIERATTLIDAKQKMRTFTPTVVSTDVSFPLRENGEIDLDAGIRLVTHIYSRHKVPCIVYSVCLREDIEERLGDAGINTGLPIFEKGANGEAWACKVMDLLLRHG